MRIEFSAFSEQGPRSDNEDRYLAPLFQQPTSAIMAIADGMGGAPGGGEAAEIAINAVRTIGSDIGHLEAIFSASASAIRTQAEAAPEKARMGTTLSVAAIKNGEVHVAHVGDTRIYLLRGKGLKNLTEDQTEVAELLRKGILTESQARRYPRRNVILSALTAKEDYVLYRSHAKLEAGDRLLLLSDGVYQRVKRGGILNASKESVSVNGFVSSIERRVVDAGPSDNFTALAVEIIEI